MTIPPEAIQACNHATVVKLYKALEQAKREGAAAERDRILRIARNVRAVCPADHPIGAMASFASYIETLAEADLLDGDPA